MLDADPDRYVRGIDVYENGFIVVQRKMPRTKSLSDAMAGNGRSAISELSFRSRARMIEAISTTSIQFRSMITLTYPRIHPINGKVVKRHLNAFRVAYDRLYGTPVFWFLEFQARGAPHLHLLSTLQGVGDGDRSNLATLWVDRALGLGADGRYFGLEGLERDELRRQACYVARRKQSWSDFYTDNGAIHYCTSYCSKTSQKEVPKDYEDVGRFWGCSQEVRQQKIPKTTFDMEADLVRSILADEGHPAGGYNYLPTVIWGSKSFTEATE